MIFFFSYETSVFGGSILKSVIFYLDHRLHIRCILDGNILMTAVYADGD